MRYVLSRSGQATEKSHDHVGTIGGSGRKELKVSNYYATGSQDSVNYKHV